MFGWFRRRLAPGGLGAVGDQPTEVRVEGHIASANELVSPLTGLRAAFFMWRLVVRYEDTDPLLYGHDQYRREVFEPIASASSRGDLWLDTKWGTLLVQVNGLTFYAPATDQGVVSLDRPPPIPELVSAFEAAKHPVSVQEQTLCHGDRVRVMGPVERVGIHTDLGAYRTPLLKTPDFRTRRDVGSVELVDLSLQDL